MARAARLHDTLARVQSALGVFPLGAYLGFHLWEQWPALVSPEAWVDRVRSTTSRGWEITLVLVPLVAHAGLGVWRMLRDEIGSDTPDASARGLRRLQALTGAVTFAFLAYHLVQVWGPTSPPHASARDGYAALWSSLGRPLDLIAYLVGVSCVCFHFAHGLARAAVTWNLVRDAAALRRTRLVAGATGFLLWGAMLHLAGHFALGEGLFAGPARALAALVGG
jgi:succinate dehydrogenase / fumarate reductase cytochrome b subunit